jgi:predicted RNase H-like HicB family nuclease
MMREFHVVVERDEDGYYVASVPALRGCHTQAKSLDELMSRIREAIQLCLEVEGSRRTASNLSAFSAFASVHEPPAPGVKIWR